MMGTSGGVTVSELEQQSGFESHLLSHSYSLVPQLSKKAL